jgi:hypothetical protein
MKCNLYRYTLVVPALSATAQAAAHFEAAAIAAEAAAAASMDEDVDDDAADAADSVTTFSAAGLTRTQAQAAARQAKVGGTVQVQFHSVDPSLKAAWFPTLEPL